MSGSTAISMAPRQLPMTRRKWTPFLIAGLGAAAVLIADTWYSQPVVSSEVSAPKGGSRPRALHRSANCRRARRRGVRPLDRRGRDDVHRDDAALEPGATCGANKVAAVGVLT
jgi:hypothetical protein